MAVAAGALAVASSLLSIGAGVYQYGVSRANAENQEDMAKLRALQREKDLRRTLAAQRVALASQGDNPYGPAGQLFATVAEEDAQLEGKIDEFETDIVKANTKAQGVTALLGGVSGSANSLLSYSRTRQQAQIKKGA